MTVQSERAFQKQPHIFQNSKVKAKSARPGKGGRRWYKDVGLGFRTPKTAIEGSYIGTFSDDDGFRIHRTIGQARPLHERWTARTFGATDDERPSRQNLVVEDKKC